MEQTVNYGLRKPGYDDFVDVQDLNYNADKIDSELYKLNSSSGGKKYATVVVGTADAGYTARDVDILIPAGSTNCIAQLNAALATVPAMGGKILLLSGTYTFTSPWVIERDNVTVEGAGAGCTVLNMTGTRNYSALQADTKSYNASVFLSGRGNTFMAVTIETPNAAGYTYGLALRGANDNKIIRITVRNRSNTSTSHGIDLIGSSRNTIAGCDIGNSSGSNTNAKCYGIGMSGASDNNTITGNVFNNVGNGNTGQNGTYGIYVVNGSSGNCIKGNFFNNVNNGDAGVSYGIHLYASVNRNIVSENTFSNGNTADRTVTGAFALYIHANNNSYNQIINNNLTGVTQAADPGSAYTTNGTAASPIPGSATTIASLGTGGACGFNVA